MLYGLANQNCYEFKYRTNEQEHFKLTLLMFLHPQIYLNLYIFMCNLSFVCVFFWHLKTPKRKHTR